jgi:hypothetical protein
MSRAVGRILACGAAAFAFALAPAPAVAATPGGSTTTTTPTTTTTTTTPPVKPAPKPGVKPNVKAVAGQLTLHLQGTFPIRSGQVTIPNRAVRVGGVMRPFVAAQTVVVHVFLGPRMLHSERVKVVRSRGGTYGHFSVRFLTPHAGNVSVSAVHGSSRQLARIVARTGFSVLIPYAGVGAGGRFVQLIQSRLAALHVYIPQTGVYDGGTGLALDAYHRLLGWGTSQSLDPATTASLLAGVGSFHLRDPRAGKHAEGNLGKQLLALAIGRDVYRIYPVSSGKPSTPTVLGHFAVYDKRPGYLPDGMFFSNFFTGGYAIHGFDPAPDYPASHGCMRVPIVDAVSIYNWLNVGNVVDVYY